MTAVGEEEAVGYHPGGTMLRENTVRKNLLATYNR
jgi:hypothetical protein